MNGRKHNQELLASIEKMASCHKNVSWTILYNLGCSPLLIDLICNIIDSSFKSYNDLQVKLQKELNTIKGCNISTNTSVEILEDFWNEKCVQVTLNNNNYITLRSYAKRHFTWYMRIFTSDILYAIIMIFYSCLALYLGLHSILGIEHFWFTAMWFPCAFLLICFPCFHTNILVPIIQTLCMWIILVINLLGAESYSYEMLLNGYTNDLYLSLLYLLLLPINASRTKSMIGPNVLIDNKKKNL